MRRGRREMQGNQQLARLQPITARSGAKVFHGDFTRAAGFACARYFLLLGVRRENLVMTDVKGVVYRGRGDNNYLDELAADTRARSQPAIADVQARSRSPIERAAAGSQYAAAVDPG